MTVIQVCPNKEKVQLREMASEDEIAKLMQAFARFDTDQDGLIGTEELKRVLRFLGHNPTGNKTENQTQA